MYANQPTLEAIQQACEIFYTYLNSSASSEISLSCKADGPRNQAHEFLLEYFDQNLTTEKVYEFKTILEKTTSVYTIVLATNALVHVFSNKWTLIGADFRRSLYEYLIESIYLRSGNYLTQSTERVIVASYIKLLCRIIKTYYSDLDFNTKILEHFSKFFENFDAGTLVGIKLLEALVQDMQFDEKTSVSTKQELTSQLFFILLCRFSRHIVDFKDHCLPKIIEVAFQVLGKLHNSKGITDNAPPEVEEDLRRSVLSLILESLRYDFLGIKYKMEDDFHEEFSPIAIPTKPNKIVETMNWNIFRNEEVINTFFEIYLASVVNGSVDNCLLSLKIINCLLRIKIQFFKNEQGQLSYIELIIRGLNNILRNAIGLDNEDILLEFSSVVRKTNRNMNLALYLTNQEYLEWLELLYQFTMRAIGSIPNKVITLQNLVSFWAFFVPYAASLEGEQINTLRQYINKITFAYIDSKLQISKLGSDCEEAHLIGFTQSGSTINHEFMMQHVKNLGQIASLHQKEICTILAGKFKDLVEALKGQYSSDAKTQLVWIIYIFIEIVCNSRSPYAQQQDNQQMFTEGGQGLTASQQEYQMKGDIVSEVFKFFSFTEAIKNEGNRGELFMLQETCLHFMQQFVKSYFSDKNNLGDDTIFIQIAANLGLGDKTEVISFIIQQVLSVFKAQNEDMSRKMVSVLEKLISNLNFHFDRANGQRLLKIGKLIISDNIFSPLFKQHLDDGYASIRNLDKDRFRVYKVLSRVLHMSLDNNYDQDAIPNFMVPFRERTAAITEQLARASKGSDSHEVISHIIGLLYDVTGTLCCLESLAYPHSEKKYVSMVESLFFIGFFESMAEILRIFMGHPKLIIVMLKFCVELVENKCMRIAPKGNSDLGPRVFKYVSRVTNMVGAYIIENAAVFSKLPSNEAYIRNYKPVSLIAKVAGNLVGSKLVNFAVLQMYKDPDCDKFYEVLFTLILITPVEEVTSYIKRSKSIYQFLEILSRNYLSFFAKFPVETFAKILELIHDGIQSLDLSVSINSMDFLSNFCGQLLNISSDKANQEWVLTLKQYIALSSEKLQAILKTSFIMILNGEVSNYSYFARMIFALIIIENTYFINLIAELSTFYGEEKTPYLTECFHELTGKVGAKFISNSKDKFKKSLEMFAEKALLLK